MEIRDKKITIFGLGRSGVAVAKLAQSLGAIVRISEIKDTNEIKQDLRNLNLKDIDVELGKHTEQFIKNSDLIVLSPGIKSDSFIATWAKENGIEFISEIELAHRFCKAPVIATTGTNGKTTVTTLIGELLKLTGKRVFVCGNIGEPFSKFVLDIQPNDLVSLEVSSFQLETIINFKPKVAVFLNFSRNHLDRYNNINEYLEAKKRIFLNQQVSDFAVLNYDDPILKGISKEIKSKTIFFNSPEIKQKFPELNPNFLAAMSVGSIFGISEKDCLKVFRNFKGVEHRLEYVTTINGVDYINDSKSTTVDSCVWALSNVNKPVIMISGGRDKGSDFSSIRALLRSKVKEMIIIGEAREKIKNAYKDIIAIKEADSLIEALDLANQDSIKGDTVLLCPMCSSFDMFRDFEERGNAFKKIVINLNKYA